MNNDDKFKKLTSKFADVVNKTTAKVTDTVNSIDTENIKKNLTNIGNKVISEVSNKYDEAVGEDKYCVVCGKKLGIIGKRKIVDGTLCFECSKKFKEIDEKENINIAQRTASELVEIKRIYEEKQKRYFKLAMAGLVVVMVICFIGLGIGAAKERKEHENKINVSEINYSLSSDNYELIANKFRDAGFSNIKFVELEDLPESKKSEVGKVEKIEINGNSNIKEMKWEEKTSVITIYYHTLEPEKTISNPTKPSSSSSNKSSDIEEYIKELEKLLKEYEKDNSKYEVKLFMHTVFINNYIEGLEETGNLALYGVSEAKQVWNNLVKEGINFNKVIREDMNSNGFKSYGCTLCIGDPKLPKDHFFIEITDGEVVNDAVNDN